MFACKIFKDEKDSGKQFSPFKATPKGNFMFGICAKSDEKKAVKIRFKRNVQLRNRQICFS